MTNYWKNAHYSLYFGCSGIAKGLDIGFYG